MRITQKIASFALLLAAASPGLAQERESAEQIADAFFQGRNHAAAEAVATCPGDDSRSDAIMASLTRPRPEEQTRQLTSRWGVVPECRLGEVLAWAEQATQVLTGRAYAASLSRTVLALDSVQGLRLLREAASDPLVPPEARGAYQLAIYDKLSLADQTNLYIDTFRAGLQVGRYRSVGMRYLFDGSDPAGAAIQIISAVLEDAGNVRASDVLGRVMGVVTSLDRFGPSERLRIWSEMERHLESVPPTMRTQLLAYEELLKSGRQ